MGNLFWISLLEGCIWILLWGLFLSSPGKLAVIWFFLPHMARSVIGFIILKNLPNTYQVIENMKDYESQTLEEIQNFMIGNFKVMLSENEAKLKPFLITYFILTIVNLIIDIIMFIVLLYTWGNQGYQFTNIVVLIVILIFYICDLVYFEWMANLRFSFPEEMLKPIRQAVIGFITELKDKISLGISTAYNIVRGRNPNESISQNNNNNNNVNNNENKNFPN